MKFYKLLVTQKPSEMIIQVDLENSFFCCMVRLKSISKVLLLSVIYCKKVGLCLFLMARETIMFFTISARELHLKRNKNIFLKILSINTFILINLQPMMYRE